jgi:G3E family GTPase
MNLRKIQPTDIGSSPETGIQELMRNFLIRTNFVPGVRHVIGWRGLQDASLTTEGWTAKIKDSSGVYGIYFEKVEKVDGWINGRFGLNYFPNPEEELVELFSLQAGSYTQDDNYMSHIRNFLSYPQMCELFNIGIIDLCVNYSGDALILGLESISRQRVIAKDGISFLQDDRMVELISPGGFDQDFPSYKTALSFYSVLAASITFNLEEPPGYLKHIDQPATEVVYDSRGKHWENLSNGVQKKYLCLGYGKTNFGIVTEKIISNSPVSTETEAWEEGDDLLPEYQNALWWKAHQISDYKTLDKQILGVDDRPQLIVLTGFLGSGKTSFLQHFIEYEVQRNRFVAIIQNEIGEVGLDGKLLDHDYAVTEIDEGCICCTLVGNLKKAIHQILSSFHPDYIVLETTGLANPYNLLDEISELEELVRFDSITTMVDGLNVEQSIEEYDVAREQIKAADILLLNKKDLLTDNLLRAVIGNLKGINPVAPILATVRGDINPAMLYGVDMQENQLSNHRKEPKALSESLHPSHQHDGLSSVKISFEEPLDRTSFIKAVKAMPNKIFRVKGVVDFKDADKPLLFQYVGGRFEFSEFNNLKMSDRFLVLIGQDIQKGSELIERQWKDEVWREEEQHVS